MKVLNFGSLNYDHIYEMDHFITPKETASSMSYSRGLGGKGLNQSIALAKAGLETYHAGRIGYDGGDLVNYLNQYGVNTDYLMIDSDVATGHAIIQVCNAENCIILYGGANQKIDADQVDAVLSYFEKGDLLLLQNEISAMGHLIAKAHEMGMKIAFNAAPMDEKVFQYPLEYIDLFIVNEVEGRGLARCESTDYNEIISALQKQYPKQEIILTLGGDGACYIHGETVIRQDAFKVEAVDTTAAGDTFTGFYLTAVQKEKDPSEALRIASKASSLCVGRKGAATAIPSLEEVLSSL